MKVKEIFQGQNHGNKWGNESQQMEMQVKSVTWNAVQLSNNNDKLKENKTKRRKNFNQTNQPANQSMNQKNTTQKSTDRFKKNMV